ncbi:MAG: polysaccharide deacetylase family protein [Pseudomonadota bacterium]|uniref:polysaccharide deacetylase family protein n=2 Tax=Aquabacterium TaxID=92793 RepID=UPI001DAA022C|nr:polysaccharide deacetylase family protein [Aquabacterium sp.]MBT9609016.1 polysaccharide deacetylase family protein [Aquabacterium sp.]
MGRPIFSLTRLSGGAQAALPVLMYHRVLPERDPLQAETHTARTMDTQFRTLARWFKALPLDEAASLLAEGRLPPRAISITFDDGYRDNHDIALPLLQRHGLTATFYVSSGFLNGGTMFHDVMVETVRHAPTGPFDLGLKDAPPVILGDVASRVAALDALVRQVKYLDPVQRERLSERLLATLGHKAPHQLMMDDEQVRALTRAGMSVGGHTTQHLILARLGEASAWEEIRSNADVLSSLTGQRITSFAYPNGKPGTDYGPEHVEMVRRAGFLNAVSTRSGVGTRSAPRFELPRFVLNETTTAGILMRMLRMTAYPVGEAA